MSVGLLLLQLDQKYFFALKNQTITLLFSELSACLSVLSLFCGSGQHEVFKARERRDRGGREAQPHFPGDDSCVKADVSRGIAFPNVSGVRLRDRPSRGACLDLGYSRSLTGSPAGQPIGENPQAVMPLR